MSVSIAVNLCILIHNTILRAFERDWIHLTMVELA